MLSKSYLFEKIKHRDEKEIFWRLNDDILFTVRFRILKPYKNDTFELINTSMLKFKNR